MESESTQTGAAWRSWRQTWEKLEADMGEAGGRHERSWRQTWEKLKADMGKAEKGKSALCTTRHLSGQRRVRVLFALRYT